MAKKLGYTKGFGSFHIPESLYKKIIIFLEQNNISTQRHFGYGPSKRIKLLDTAFSLLGLDKFTQHRIKREFFLFPIAKNLHNVILKDQKPKYYSYTFNELNNYWLERWGLPRSYRDETWKKFEAKKFLNLQIKNYGLN